MENINSSIDTYNILEFSKKNNSDESLVLDEYKNESSIFDENNCLTNSISDNYKSLEEVFQKAQDKQGIIGQAWNGFKNLTNLGFGSDDVAAEIEQYKQGKITYEEALEAIESYEDKQDGAISLISNTLSGLLTAGFAISTGGIGALFMGALVGGVANAGFKTIDRASNNVKNDALDVNEVVKDGLTGAVDGFVSAATAGLVKAPVAGQTIKEVIKLGAIQGAKAGAITGAATGAADYTINTVADKEQFTIDGLVSTTAQNALSGVVFGGLFGGISGGLAQKKLSSTYKSEIEIKHNDNLDIEIDNDFQSKRYLDNFNENNKSQAIVGEAYDEKIKELNNLSKKSQKMARKYDSQLDEAAYQFDGVFAKNDDIELVTARAKGQNSIFSKLAKKNIEDLKELDTMTQCCDAIGDAIGVRVQVKNLDYSETTEIVETILEKNGISASFDDFLRYIQGDKIDDETKQAFLSVSDEIIDSLKTKQTQSVVSQLCDGIRDGSVKITELNNYGDEITSYFTNKQIHEIIDAYSDAVKNEVVVQQKPLKVVSNSSLMDLSETEVLPRDVVKWVKTNDNGVNVEFSQIIKGAKKESGYTSGQMNTKHVLNNSKIVNGELQIRGVEVNGFAEVEHIPYDIRKGKIFSDDSKYSEIYNLIKTMSDDNYSKYNEYLAATYKTLRMKELGLLGTNAPMPKIGEFIKEGISALDLAKLDIDGLMNISK